MKEETGFKYQDTHQPVDVRVKDLISRMTLEEKIREMGMCLSSQILKEGKFSSELAHHFFNGKGIGAIQDPRLDPVESAEVINEIQKFLINNTRLGIPALVVAECLHGFMSPEATIFPQSIGLAGTWDTGTLW